jgi:hypothetical protein
MVRITAMKAWLDAINPFVAMSGISLKVDGDATNCRSQKDFMEPALGG